mmetsp:Transcript_14652/g.62850  ORF Transcript_14652/g.62850 Transcript_14652/m.62850 type:complete len:371 (-) Transcript_14652:268-1380(-)
MSTTCASEKPSKSPSLRREAAMRSSTVISLSGFFSDLVDNSIAAFGSPDKDSRRAFSSRFSSAQRRRSASYRALRAWITSLANAAWSACSWFVRFSRSFAVFKRSRSAWSRQSFSSTFTFAGDAGDAGAAGAPVGDTGALCLRKPRALSRVSVPLPGVPVLPIAGEPGTGSGVSAFGVVFRMESASDWFPAPFCDVASPRASLRRWVCACVACSISCLNARRSCSSSARIFTSQAARSSNARSWSGSSRTSAYASSGVLCTYSRREPPKQPAFFLPAASPFSASSSSFPGPPFFCFLLLYALRSATISLEFVPEKSEPVTFFMCSTKRKSIARSARRNVTTTTTEPMICSIQTPPKCVSSLPRFITTTAP